MAATPTPDDTGAVEWQLVDPAGEPARLTVGPPKELTLFWHGPWRMFASLTNDVSWWVDVRTSRFPYAVVREAYPTRDEALARAHELRALYESGRLERSLPLLRERFRRPRP